MPSFAPCLHEEADTSMFARATEAAKRPNKKISSCAAVVLVIPVVQQFWVDELRGLQKITGYHWCESKLPCTHRVQKHILSPWLWKTVGKLSKMNSLSEKPPTFAPSLND